MTYKIKVSFAALLLAAACGGSGENAALGKQFNYGSAQAPTTSESDAVSSAQAGVTASSSFSSSPSADGGLAIAGMAMDLSAALGGFSVPGKLRQQDVAQSIRRAVGSPADFATCATVTSTSATFNNCSQTENGLTLTINGHVSAATGTVTWDITVGISGSSSGETFNFGEHAAGSYTVTSTTVKGTSTVELSGSASGNGQSISFGLALAAILDVTYTSSCVTSPSSIEVKRVWTQRPQGISSSDVNFSDAGVKVSWSGCNQFTVAHSQ